MLRSLRLTLVPFLLLAALASAQAPPPSPSSAPSPQAPPAAASRGVLLTVEVPGKPDATYTLLQFRHLSQRTVRAVGHDGAEHSYTGVNLGDLLAAAGVPRGMELHGAYLHDYALATGADKYSVVFALPELDPGYTDKTVLVAWSRDGQALAADQGPLQIVVPEDKHPARWVRQLVRITVKEAG
jgi:hypothetical protein